MTLFDGRIEERMSRDVVDVTHSRSRDVVLDDKKAHQQFLARIGKELIINNNDANEAIE